MSQQSMQINIEQINSDEFIDNKIDNLSVDWGLMITLQKNLNKKIGILKWKKYITASIWNYISTPINFTITLFTALSAGQTSTSQSYLTQNELFYLLFISFVLSTINTFFKLKDKAIMNYDAYKKYDKFGNEFESIYFKAIANDNDVKARMIDYNMLQKRITDYYGEENIENVNYIPELFFTIIRHIMRINTEQIKINERIWILDGEEKNKYYRKNNIEFDNKKLFLYADLNEFREMNKNNNTDLRSLNKPNRNIFLEESKSMKLEDILIEKEKAIGTSFTNLFGNYFLNNRNSNVNNEKDNQKNNLDKVNYKNKKNENNSTSKNKTTDNSISDIEMGNLKNIVESENKSNNNRINLSKQRVDKEILSEANAKDNTNNESKSGNTKTNNESKSDNLRPDCEKKEFETK